jgi:hypothetical protein
LLYRQSSILVHGRTGIFEPCGSESNVRRALAQECRWSLPRANEIGSLLPVLSRASLSCVSSLLIQKKISEQPCSNGEPIRHTVLWEGIRTTHKPFVSCPYSFPQHCMPYRLLIARSSSSSSPRSQSVYVDLILVYGTSSSCRDLSVVKTPTPSQEPIW